MALIEHFCPHTKKWTPGPARDCDHGKKKNQGRKQVPVQGVD